MSEEAKNISEVDPTGSVRVDAGVGRPEEMITVCDKCLMASCWHGEFMCWESRGAGTTQRTRRELISLGLEHPDYIHN